MFWLKLCISIFPDPLILPGYRARTFISGFENNPYLRRITYCKYTLKRRELIWHVFVLNNGFLFWSVTCNYVESWRYGSRKNSWIERILCVKKGELGNPRYSIERLVKNIFVKISHARSHGNYMCRHCLKSKKQLKISAYPSEKVCLKDFGYAPPPSP